MSTSSVVSSASALCGSQEGGGAPRRADVDDLRLVLASQKRSADVGELLVLVRVLRDDAALSRKTCASIIRSVEISSRDRSGFQRLLRHSSQR